MSMLRYSVLCCSDTVASGESMQVRSARMQNRSCHFAVNAEEIGNSLRWASAHAALGGDAEICEDALRCLNAPLRSLDSIGKMYQSQVEFRLWMQLQVP